MDKIEIPFRLPSLNEKWKDVKGYEGIYQVSNLGRVKSLDRKVYQKNKSNKFQYVTYKGKILKSQKQRNGYLIIDLHRNNKTKRKLVHILVAETWIPNLNSNKYINHKDSNPQNNRIDNLEWCTQSYNVKYAYKNGNKIAPNMKKTNQIKNGKIINTYISMTDAERKTGIKSANISKCCRNIRKHAGGFQWEYSE